MFGGRGIKNQRDPRGTQKIIPFSRSSFVKIIRQGVQRLPKMFFNGTNYGGGEGGLKCVEKHDIENARREFYILVNISADIASVTYIFGRHTHIRTFLANGKSKKKDSLIGGEGVKKDKSVFNSFRFFVGVEKACVSLSLLDKKISFSFPMTGTFFSSNPFFLPLAVLRLPLNSDFSFATYVSGN